MPETDDPVLIQSFAVADGAEETATLSRILGTRATCTCADGRDGLRFLNHGCGDVPVGYAG